MPNNYSISDALLIAALEAKVDIVDTVVDAIRATDVPNIQTNIDANETKIDTVDTVVDAIKLKTDDLPYLFRGAYNSASLTTTNAAFQTVLDIPTGSGIITNLIVKCYDAADTLELKLTLDGTVFTTLSHTGATTTLFVMKHIDDALVICATAEYWHINLEFSTSLKLELRRSAGAANDVFASIAYSLDP